MLLNYTLKRLHLLSILFNSLGIDIIFVSLFTWILSSSLFSVPKSIVICKSSTRASMLFSIDHWGIYVRMFSFNEKEKTLRVECFFLLISVMLECFICWMVFQSCKIALTYNISGLHVLYLHFSQFLMLFAVGDSSLWGFRSS